MTLVPNITETLARARADLRMGVPVAVTNGDGGALIVAVETLTSDRLQSLRDLGAVSIVITARRAETLKARCYDGDIARLQLPADAGLDWVRALADPADDLRAPMKGPLISQRGGSSALHRAAIHLCKQARLLPSALVQALPDVVSFAAKHNLTLVDLNLAQDVMSATSALHPVISASLPLAVSEAGKLHVFRPEDGSEEHYAIEIGRPARDQPVLTRLHSACFTGDLLGSLKCDCGPQLRGAMRLMGENGGGILLYLNQEGRGIGLANKMRAYSLQDQGFDTVEANHRLGFEDDERDLKIGAAILNELGVTEIRLMTNNPAKVAMMKSNGIAVTERVPLKVGRNPQNTRYLDTKSKKSGHLL